MVSTSHHFLVKLALISTSLIFPILRLASLPHSLTFPASWGGSAFPARHKPTTTRGIKSRCAAVLVPVGDSGRFYDGVFFIELRVILHLVFSDMCCDRFEHFIYPLYIYLPCIVQYQSVNLCTV